MTLYSPKVLCCLEFWWSYVRYLLFFNLSLFLGSLTFYFPLSSQVRITPSWFNHKKKNHCIYFSTKILSAVLNFFIFHNSYFKYFCPNCHFFVCSPCNSWNYIVNINGTLTVFKLSSCVSVKEDPALCSGFPYSTQQMHVFRFSTLFLRPSLQLRNWFLTLECVWNIPSQFELECE